MRASLRRAKCLPHGAVTASAAFSERCDRTVPSRLRVLLMGRRISQNLAYRLSRDVEILGNFLDWRAALVILKDGIGW
jgi:hypothetical protein